MFGRDDKPRPFDVAYRLPASVVRFSGVRTTTKVSYKPDSLRVTAGAQIEVRADHRPAASKCLTLPKAGNGEVTLDLELLDDGRLVSGGITVDPKNDSLWPTVVANALSGAAAGGVTLGPAGAIGGALIGGLGTAAVGRFVVEDLGAGEKPDKPDDTAPTVRSNELQTVSLPKAEDVGVVRKYYDDHENEAELLIAYRVAIGRLKQEHAALALRGAGGGTPDYGALRSLERSILSCQRVAQGSEALYNAWLMEQVSETREVVDFERFLDQLPTEKELFEKCQGGRDGEPWWEIIDDLEIMVTCDVVAERLAASPEPNSDEGQHICFRQPQLALAKTWKVRDDKKAGGDKMMLPQLVEASWLLVALSGSERYIPVPDEKASKAGLTVGISPTGGLIKIGSKETSGRVSRAAALAGLGGSVSGSITAGQALVGAFSPTAIETARLTGQAGLAEARAKLQPPGADPLKDLRGQVEEVELVARLAVAGQLATDPTSATIIVPAD